MLSDLNKFLRQQIQKVPQHFLRRLIGEKLKEQGIEEDSLLDALTEHISSQKDGAFHWNGGQGSSAEDIHIEFTDHDLEELERDVKAFLDESLPDIITKTVRDSAKDLAKSLERQWSEVKVHERNEVRSFRERLELRWAAGLDPLRMMLIASREVGQEFVDRLARSKAKTGLHKRNAIAMLHMRACQTTMEILTLLESGLPDGAYARWRTLYEISVVALVIDRFGDEIAERYLAHDVVSMHESVRNEYRYDGEVYEPEKLTGEMKELEEQFRSAIAKFGSSFSGRYGWAAHSLGIKSPRFQDLEEAVDWNSLPPNYKWSSYKIHAGVAGTVRTLGSMGDSQIIHAGATNAGLETPAINAAFSLMHVTSLVFGNLKHMEAQIQMLCLVILRDKVVRECRKVARKLKKEEFELQGGFES